MKGLTLLAVSIVIITLISCKHDPINLPGTLDPNNNGNNGTDTTTNNGIPCDPDSVYFQTQVLPLIQSSCAQSGCHDAISSADGIVLNNYDNIIRTGRVRAGRLDSELYEVITDSDPDDRMPPPPAAALSTDQINIIKTWIQQGATNNTCDQNSNCNLDNITYSNTIEDIMTTACVGCHNANVQNGGIDLSSYAQVKNVGQSGQLLGSIKHQAGFAAMPQGGNKLPQCKIDQVETWINNGFAN